MKKILIYVVCMLISLPAILAQKTEKEFASYGAGIGISPFGFGLNLTHNFNSKTSLNLGIGGAPETDVPDGFIPDDNALGDVEMWRSTSSWMGMFLTHRPFDNANWFCVNFGLGIGSIENDLEIHSDDGTHEEYSADYNENPVGYLGFAARTGNVKGIQFGFELGALYTSGGEVMPVHGTSDNHERMEAIEDNLVPSLLPNIQLTISYGF